MRNIIAISIPEGLHPESALLHVAGHFSSFHAEKLIKNLDQGYLGKKRERRTEVEETFNAWALNRLKHNPGLNRLEFSLHGLNNEIREALFSHVRARIGEVYKVKLVKTK